MESKCLEVYSSYDKAQEKSLKQINTNPKYKFYKQLYFTVGDEDQFMSYCDVNSIIQREGVVNTFRYIFYKFKKGLFIQIKNNKLTTLLPFTNAYYRNEWSHLLKFNTTRFKSWNDLFSRVCELDGYKFRESRVNKFKNSWYAVNGIFRYEFPPTDNETGTSVFVHMIEELCKKRTIPDCEFFINRKDYPLLTKDKTESCEAIFGQETPLKSHSYSNYAPILSMCITERHSDILLPTTDDWARICAGIDIYFPKTQRYDLIKPTEWKEKKPIAVFRGTLTGYGITPETNPRLRIALMNNSLLDAGITKLNNRPRINNGVVDIVSDEPLNRIVLKPHLSAQEQSTFKYIINIDGHVAAFRLGYELGFGSVILKVDSPYRLWFSHLLQPYIHYIPVKKDLSNLIDQLEWCKSNDEKCQEISYNAQRFYFENLQKNNILDYLQDLFYTMIKK